MSRAEHSRNVRASVEERRNQALANWSQYQPQVHAQIQRLFSDYEPPWYARLRGFDRSKTLALAEATVVSLAAGKSRSLSDSETQALTEHLLSTVHNIQAWKWAMTGLAAYMTYKGRRTMRFPFFNVVTNGGKYDAFTRGPRIRFVWHSARFAAYYGVIWAFGQPLFQAANFFRQKYAMAQDDRLNSLFGHGREQAGRVLGAVQASNSQHSGNDWSSDTQHEYSIQSEEDNYQAPSQAAGADKPRPWSGYRHPASSRQATTRSRGVDDDFDDASPVAPSSLPQDDGGSAWDRIRQQAQYPPKQARSRDERQTWEAPQRSTAGWGSREDASPQNRASFVNRYDASSVDEENNTPKSQAQREFDELLERERRGGGQETGTWVKR
ncbi:uncharacterized protein UV8b_05653 [Ustilaginoidea virens]|nr:uncharacterized protein UV8b_05653 [Ustilaginoidea virens]QUC21410.1 hypothetical protein UV8b_05653 [Ustilaginoidea virens]